MTNPPDVPLDDATTPSAMDPHVEDATMATPSRGRNAKPKGPAFTEITVKFRFTALESNDHVAPEVLHLHWIQITQEAFDKAMQIFNNKGAIMPKVDTMRWTPAQKHSKNYTVHRHGQGFRPFNSDKLSASRTNHLYPHISSTVSESLQPSKHSRTSLGSPRSCARTKYI